MSATNGVIIFAAFGKVTQGNQLYAQIESELRGTLDALEWIKHESKTSCELLRLHGRSPMPSPSEKPA